MKTLPPGRVLLRNWMKKHGVSQADLARALKREGPVVHAWLTNRCDPTPVFRKALSVFTHGEVPETSWLSAGDLHFIENVRPFSKTGTDS